MSTESGRYSGLFISTVNEASLYHLQEKLGEGAEAPVYRAIESNGTEWVVKLFDPASDLPLGGLQQVSVYGGLLGRVPKRHPNLPSSVTWQEGTAPHADGHQQWTATEARWHYLVMTRVPGVSLTGFVDLQRMDLRPLVGVAAALAALHTAGLVHGDVKPANIKVEQTDTSLIGRLVDLGTIAQIGHGPDRLIAGSPPYFDQRARREAHCVAHDAFSLGMTALYCLDGRAPTADRIDDLLRTLDDRIPPAPAEAIRSAITGRVEAPLDQHFASLGLVRGGPARARARARRHGASTPPPPTTKQVPRDDEHPSSTPDDGGTPTARDPAPPWAGAATPTDPVMARRGRAVPRRWGSHRSDRGPGTIASPPPRPLTVFAVVTWVADDINFAVALLAVLIVLAIAAVAA